MTTDCLTYQELTNSPCKLLKYFLKISSILTSYYQVAQANQYVALTNFHKKPSTNSLILFGRAKK